MSKRDEAKVFDEADVLIFAGAALGLSQEAIGKFVCTSAFPTGMSDRAVRYRIEEYREAYDRLVPRIGSVYQRKQEEFEALTKAQYTALRERLRSKGIAVKELALDQAISMPFQAEFLKLGVTVAESLEDRDFGRAKQAVEHSGEVNHSLVVWDGATKAELLGQEHDMIDSEDLLKALPGDVLEAEVIPTT